MSLGAIFAKNVRTIRLLRQLSQEELADRADIHRTHVSSIERAKHSPSLDVMQAIATALGVTVVELLSEDIRPAVERLRLKG